MPEKFLARHTTASLRALLDDKKPLVALVPVGSTEPHGPHLGLGTDVVISAAACVRATDMFAKKGPLTAVIAPDNVGTYEVALSQGLTFADGTTVRSGVIPQGGSASFAIIIPSS